MIKYIVCFLIGYVLRGFIHVYAGRIRKFKAGCRKKARQRAELEFKRATFDLNI